MASLPPPPEGLVLLCIDAQPIFLNAVANGEALRRRCEFVVSAAAGLRIPVVFTEQVPQKLGATDASLLKAAGAPLRQLGKQTFSAMSDDGIRDALRSLKAEHLLLCGLETSVCVYQTAIEAMDEQYQVTLLSDAIGARRPDDARACVEALVRASVHVLPSETIFYALLHDVKHPFFKGFTHLVKSYA